MLLFLLHISTSLIKNSIFKTVVPQNYDEISNKFDFEFTKSGKNIIFTDEYTTLNRKVCAHVAILQNYIKDRSSQYHINELNDNEGITYDITKQTEKEAGENGKNMDDTQNDNFAFNLEFIRSVCSVFYYKSDNDNFISLPLCTFFEVFILNYKNIATKLCKKYDFPAVDIENCLLLSKCENKNKWKELIQNDIIVFAYKFASLKANKNNVSVDVDELYNIIDVVEKNINGKKHYKKVAECYKNVEELKNKKKVNDLKRQKNKKLENDMKPQKSSVIEHKINNKKKLKTKTCDVRYNKKERKKNELHAKKMIYKIKSINIIKNCCFCLELANRKESDFVYFLLDTVTYYTNCTNLFNISYYDLLQLLRIAEINYLIHGTFLKYVVNKGDILFSFVNAATVETHKIIIQPFLPAHMLTNFQMFYFTFIQSKIKQNFAKNLNDEIFYDLYFPIYYMIFSKCAYKLDNGKKYDSCILTRNIKMLSDKYKKIINVLLNKSSYRVRPNKYTNVKEFFRENKNRHKLLDIWYNQLFVKNVALDYNFKNTYGNKKYNQYSYKKITSKDKCIIQ
ncbi:hypothetical protein BDAP_002590 [Binucleata daphniae]